MGGLRPIGSEKLQGADKIARILEIAKYNERIPQSINETSRTEFTFDVDRNNRYNIVKERQGYIIKQQISESVNDYIEPIENRKYYSSYSQALKRLNLIIKEHNISNNNKEGVSLFGEQKKFKLKVPKQASDQPAPELPVSDVPVEEPDNVPPPTDNVPADNAPMDDMPMDDMGGDEMGDDMSNEDMPTDDMGGDEMMDDDMPNEEPNENNSFKSIQKLVGKLGQKLRTYTQNNEGGMSSDDTKYVINSVLSALDLDSLDENDVDEILSRFEGSEEDDSMGDDMGNDMGDDEMMDDIPMDDDMSNEEPEGEMGENYGRIFGNKAAEMMSDRIKNMGSARFGELDEFEDESWFEETDDINDMLSGFDDTIEDDDIEFRRRGPRSRISYPDNDMFVESRIDDILGKYITEDTKLKSTKSYKLNLRSVESLSETTKQKQTALSLINKNPNITLVGKTNKGNLLFNEGKKITKVDTKGKLL